jgi:hypothetical protein
MLYKLQSVRRGPLAASPFPSPSSFPIPSKTAGDAFGQRNPIFHRTGRAGEDVREAGYNVRRLKEDLLRVIL